MKKKKENKNGFNKSDEFLNLSSEESDESYQLDDDELSEEAKKLSQQYKKSKLISVFELLGKPAAYQSIKSNVTKNELVKLLSVLEMKGVTVIFNNDYPIDEKYRFIVEEIMKQGVEKNNKHSIVNFVYEDFYPFINPGDDLEEI